MTKKRNVLTLGTSNNTWQRFQDLLERAGADVVVDVRKSPFSRHAHFCHSEFKAKLNFIGISYIGLPDLGGLSANDHRSYSEATKHPAAQAGLELIDHLASRATPVLVCSEGDPTTCHRCLMISPALIARGLQVNHVQPDGKIETHAETQSRLVRRLKLREAELWESWEQIAARAFQIQERKIRRLK